MARKIISRKKKVKIINKKIKQSFKKRNIKKMDDLPEIQKKDELPNIQKKNKGNLNKYPTLKLESEREIAMDFAEKVYERFDRLVKSIILFGSTMKGDSVAGSDIDIIIIVDDAIVKFDETLIRWYREELGKIINSNPYKKDLHINTVKLTTWWEDLYRGDPVIINIIRYGESIIDFAGFFEPFKILLQDGKIRLTPEAIYTILNRVPEHIVRSEIAQVSAIDGCYWSMIESAQALLMAINVLPPSPEHIAELLKKHFVEKKLLKSYYVNNLVELYNLHKKIIHGETKNIDGSIIDDFQKKSNDFFKVVLKLIQEIVE